MNLLQTWEATWPEALRCWSAYTQLREPLYFIEDKDAAPQQMSGQLAAIRLSDHVVMVNLGHLSALGLQDCALQILAHEIGHHVYVPGNLNDHARMLAIMRALLYGLPNETTSLCANLYSDLLINDRLQRSAGLDMAKVYQRLREQPAPTMEAPPKKKNKDEKIPA